MTPADVRQVPVVRAPAAGGPDGHDFAMRAPLPLGVYPDAGTALRAALHAAPGWLRFLMALPAVLGRPVRRWGAYLPRRGDRLGPLSVVAAGPHRVTVAGSARGVTARLEIQVTDGAVTARGTVRGGPPAGRAVLRLLARTAVRTLLARSAGFLAARAQPSASTFANTAEPAVANTIV